jgi:hypothetical protein
VFVLIFVTTISYETISFISVLSENRGINSWNGFGSQFLQSLFFSEAVV